MEVKGYFDWLENNLFKYKYVIGILIIFLLVTLIIATFKNFEKQNQIIETCGFTDGKIKCVCTQEAWNTFESSQKYRQGLLNISVNQT